MSAPPAPGGADAAQVVTFWEGAGSAKWFRKDPAFDAEFRERFLALHEQAAAGRLDGWATESKGALALLLLLDQFPRNAFRGTARMYATDPKALEVADRALEAGLDEGVEPALRLFFYLPFSHSEALADQERAVLLHERIRFTEHAIGHRDVVRRFGRFPHRNAILSRASTPEEEAYLAGEGAFLG